MSNDVYPIRAKTFRPDTPIQDCPICGRKNAIAGIWHDDTEEYFVPKQCNKCKDAKRPHSANSRPAASTSSPCKNCRKSFPRSQLTYGRCPRCSARADQMDTKRLCVDCHQPFITQGHIEWFASHDLDAPKSHAAIKQSCPPATKIAARVSTTSTPPAKTGFWAGLKKWFQGS